MDSGKESRRSTSAALAALIELGPSYPSEVAEVLWSGGMTVSRGATKKEKPKRSGPRDATTKLITIAQLGLAESTTSDGGRWQVAPRAGRVWVIYVATRRILAGVYDARVQCITPLVEHRLRSSSESFLRVHDLLDKGVETLAEAVLRTPKELRTAAGVAIGLPAALDPGATNISRPNPQNWAGMHVAQEFADAWDRLRESDRRYAELPDIPHIFGTPSVCVDSDVVFDTLAAMHPRLSGKLHDGMAHEGLVLGVKHSGGVRSTLIERGNPLQGRQSDDRKPGTRRDHVVRGASGGTLGLGHTIAYTDTVIANVSRKPPGFVDAREFALRLRDEQRGCSCGEINVTHLDSLVSADRLAERLNIRDREIPLHELIQQTQMGAEQRSATGSVAKLVLEETGRLMAHAIDLATRLYDPSAVFVTGTLPYSDRVWSGLTDAFQLLTPRGHAPRPLWRSADIEGTGAHQDPIGPRGGAWLALDTFVYPSLLQLVSKPQQKDLAGGA